MTYPTPEEAAAFAKGLAEAHERMTGGMPDAEIPPARAKTQAVPFLVCNHKQQRLFAVQAGISRADAHNQLVVLMNVIRGILKEIDTIDEGCDAPLAAYYLVEMANALVASLPEEPWAYRDTQDVTEGVLP
ncbi:hypothetical protein FACS189441_6630 [Betaproteobacteria bacterium]|nr:hypothetical protein FACS189441_6630 [Betaproteobacteria bacterium]